MSAEATTAVLHHSKSEGSSKLVMWGIANHHSDSGAWPAIATLAKYASVSERRVQQIIRGLATMGEIRIDEQGGFGAHYKTNRYWILIQCPKDCDGSLQHRTGVKSGDSGVKSGDMRGEAQGHSGVKPVSPEPNKNLIEPIKRNPTQKAHRLPEDFKPSDKNWSEMAEHFDWVDLKKETHHFIDYWLSVPPGKATKIDWQRTWKNWIRTASNHGKPVGSPKKRNKIRAED
tara:strand:+ start:646 stop:1335 length:690 start_codon:yes stop_codon:yes gene_type:complete